MLRRRPLFALTVAASTTILFSACHSSSVAPLHVPAPIPTSDGALTLSTDEAKIRDYVRAHHEADIALLERAVNISSGSQNATGVRRVGGCSGHTSQRWVHSAMSECAGFSSDASSPRCADAPSRR